MTSETGDPTVAVITRTRDRPLFLARAALSLARQSCTDFVWVVVNDGGDAARVDAAIAQAGLPADRIRRIDHPASLGMESAANAGVAATTARYYVLHDDDDTWEPGFLAHTVAFLDSSAGARFAGVVTHANVVSEEVAGDTIVEHARGPHDPDLATIAMADLLRHNLFPPIAFLVRREMWERVGGYDPGFAVLGDWYFNVKVLFEADIAVLPRVLANWHHRDRGTHLGAAANSVFGLSDVHAAAVTQVRNQLVRDLGRRHGAGMAPLLAAMLDGDAARGAGRAARRNRDPGAGPGTNFDPAVGRVRPIVSASGGADLGESDRHRALRAVVDVADRRWIAAHLSWSARAKILLARRRDRRSGTPIDPDPTWAVLEPLLAAVHVPIPADFDEATYLAANRDVADAVVAGSIENGYTHWVRFGRVEGRLRPLRITASAR